MVSQAGSIKALIFDGHDEVCREALAITHVARLPGVTIDWRASRSRDEAYVDLAERSPDIVLVEQSQPRVLYAARRITAHVLVLAYSAPTFDENVARIELSVQPVHMPLPLAPFVELAAVAAIRSGPTRMRASPSRIGHASDVLRSIDMPLPALLSAAANQATLDTYLENGCNKVKTAEVLGTNRRWVDRHLVLGEPVKALDARPTRARTGKTSR